MPEIKKIIQNLSDSLKKYFPIVDTKENEWVISPFTDFNGSTLACSLQEQLIDLKNDLVLKRSFGEMELSAFWISLYDQYPVLSNNAIKNLLPFGSSYQCELGFSVLTEIKSKKRERLRKLDEEMRVCLSNIQPRIETICAEKQAHPSH